MSNADEKHTLWTITQESWSDLFRNTSLTPDIAEKMQQADTSAEEFKERLSPYNTPVTEETLRQSVR